MSCALSVLGVVEPTSGPIRASLQVDASGLGEAGPFVAQRLQARGELVLRDGDVLPASDPADPLIMVRIDSLTDVEGYRFRYEVQQDGGLVEGSRGSAECRLCNEAELSDQVDAAIARLVLRLRPQDVQPEVETPPPPQLRPPPPTEPQWVVGPLGTNGIVLTAVGGAAFGVGLGLAISEPILLGGNEGRNSTVAVAGLGVAVAGAAMLGTGVAMMLIERRRSRRTTAAHAWRLDGPLRLRF